MSTDITIEFSASDTRLDRAKKLTAVAYMSMRGIDSGFYSQSVLRMEEALKLYEELDEQAAKAEKIYAERVRQRE